MECITDLFGLLAAEFKESDGTLKFGLFELTITVGVGLPEELGSSECEKFLLSLVQLPYGVFFVGILTGDSLTIFELGHLFSGSPSFLLSEFTGQFEGVDGVEGLLLVDFSVLADVGELEESFEIIRALLLGKLGAEGHGGDKGGSEELFHCFRWWCYFYYNQIAERSFLYALI